MVTDAGDTTPHLATFAKVGQLVNWTSTVSDTNATITWSGDGITNSSAGPSYGVQYSTIGKKNVFIHINGGEAKQCSVPVGGLPIINIPEFEPF
jgi:hypothetical protein